MPARIPLEPPSERPGGLDDLVEHVAGAARRLADVDERLVGAAASAPGWLGDDAAAASDQIGAVTALVRTVSDALVPVVGRLAGHAEHVLTAHRQVQALLAEQDQQFRESWRRWYAVPDLQLQIMTGGPDVRAVVEEVEAGEASRQRRHHVLVEDLAADAAATARVLVDACAAVGLRGRAGDANAVVAYLAAELPGWGDLELARQGRAFADELGQPRTPGERERAAQDALAFAGSVAFADALLGALGPVSTRTLLESLGEGDVGPTSALARIVALALGAAARGGAAGPVDDVLTTDYAVADDAAGRTDLAVLGMGTVLAASLGLGSRGLDARTVSAWGRQIALRERTLGAPAIDRINPPSDDAAPVDALPVVVAILAGTPDRAAAAAFLTGPSVWPVLLERSWADCGASLRRLVASAGTLEGPAGEAVVRGGLEGLAARLEDGNADDWPVHRATANAVSPALAEGLAAHISIAGTALGASAAGGPSGGDAALLRGLGYVTLDRRAAAGVEEALAAWVQVQPVPVRTSGPPPLLPAVVVPNAYLAVQDYGQRLAYALGQIEAEREADDRAFLWSMTAGLAAGLAPGPFGVAAGIIEGFLAWGLHYDGTWETAGDHGLHFQPDVPDAPALADLSPEERTAVDRVARMAQAAYESTTDALGALQVPLSPERHWWDPIVDAVPLGPSDLTELPRRRHPPVSPIR